MNNRSTKKSACRPHRRRHGWFVSNLRNTCSLTWPSLLIIIGALILFPERPAWGGEFKL